MPFRSLWRRWFRQATRTNVTRRASLLRLGLERLEERTTPAIGVFLTGAAPNFAVTFADDSFGIVDNSMELRFNAANELEYSVNGAAFSNDLDPALFTQSATFADIAKIEVFLGVGEDRLVQSLEQFSLLAVIAPDSQNSLETDIDLDDNLSAELIDVDIRGTELIRFRGVGGDDNLTLATGVGDHAARISNAASGGDLVESDFLPDVEFDDIGTFLVNDTGSGIDNVTFITRNLDGATTYTTNLNQFDTLIIEGGDSLNDSFTITKPAVGFVAIRDNGSAKLITETSSASVSVVVNSLNGDDSLTVNVNGPTGSNVIANPITFDGGLGSDLLTVTGAPTTAVDEVIYGPGPGPDAGRLAYEDAGNVRLMTIDFIGLEPIDEQTAAAKLTIRGTTGNDVFSYTAAAVATKGLVRVENFETLEFVNKGRLTLEGLAGNDSFSMSNPSIPTGLTNTTVTGGDGYDSITVNEMGTTGVLTTTTANFTGKTPITFDTVEQIGFGVNTLADVGAIVNEAARSPFVWLFGTHQFRQRIGIRNLSSSLAVSGPLVVAFNLPGGVALTNRTGFTTVIAPAGRPFIRYTVADNVISPAERARRRAVFGHGPVALQKLQSQGYTINVFAGLGTA